MTLAEALRDDPNDPYVRGGVVYLVVRAIAPGQTLREILCSYAPEKQWLEDLPAGVPECEAPVPSRDRSPNGLRSGLL